MSRNTVADESRRAIEAILMVADEPVEVGLLAQLLEVSPARIEEMCDELAAAYDAEDRGFVIVRVAGGFRFQSHPDLAPYVERFVLEGQSARLSAAALETLAIIAYKQPVSRAQIVVDPRRRGRQRVADAPTRGYVAKWSRPGPGRRCYGPPVSSSNALRQQPGRPAALGDSFRRGGGRSPQHACATGTKNVEWATYPEGAGPGGYGSRRVCEELSSRTGHRQRRAGDPRPTVDADVDRVAVDDAPVSIRDDLVYSLLNKPKGVVTPRRIRNGGAPSSTGAVGTPRLSGGRLDRDSGVCSPHQRRRAGAPPQPPAFGIEKDYLVEIEGTPSPSALRRLREGVVLDDGMTARREWARSAPRC